QSTVWFRLAHDTAASPLSINKHSVPSPRALSALTHIACSVLDVTKHTPTHPHTTHQHTTAQPTETHTHAHTHTQHNPTQPTDTHTHTHNYTHPTQPTDTHTHIHNPLTHITD